jgi:tripartite-type tricarboxylate transporter receptor subunit TctC
VIAYVKARPGQVACANAGNGSKGHMALLMLCHLTGMQLNHIPFRGSAPAQSALLAGTVPLCIDTASVYIPHVQSRALRGIAVTSTQRMSLMPDVPTVAEQGIPGFDATVWYGAVGPAGLPPQIAPRVAEIVDRWGRSSEGSAMLTQLGMIALGGTPDDLAQAVKRELEVWGPIVKEAGIVVE